MKLTILFLLATLATSAFSFTLVSENPHKFTNSKVLVNIDSDSCQKLNMDSEALLNLSIEAVNKTWNRVENVSIKLVRGVETNSKHPETILVSCFESNANDENVYGGVNGTFHFVKVTKMGLEETALSHAFGHALGLGHSADDSAHMFYLFPNPELSEDDKDGFKYLYGIK